MTCYKFISPYMAIKLGLQRDLLHEDSAEGVVFEKIARRYRCLRPIDRVCPDKVLLIIGVAVAIGVLIAPLVEVAEFGVLPGIRQTVLIVILLGRKGNDKAYRRSIPAPGSGRQVVAPLPGFWVFPGWGRC